LVGWLIGWLSMILGISYGSTQNVAIVYDFVSGICLKDMIQFCKEGKVTYEHLVQEVSNVAATLGHMHRATSKDLQCQEGPCILADKYYDNECVTSILQSIQESQGYSVDIASVLERLRELKLQAKSQPVYALVCCLASVASERAIEMCNEL
jgi:hypothetical protein